MDTGCTPRYCPTQLARRRRFRVENILRELIMDERPHELDPQPKVVADAPLPLDVEQVSAYAWQRGALETILFHGAAQLTTAAGPLELEGGTWLLARWSDLPLAGIPDGELVCILPETHETS
jgi:hypothetical protein